MALESVPIGKSLAALARPALKFAREQWSRRDASLETLKSFDADRELNEALDTLRGDAQSACRGFKSLRHHLSMT